MENNITLPHLFLQRLQNIVHEDDLDNVVASFSSIKPISFRINTLKTTVNDEPNEIDAKTVPGFKNAFLIPNDKREALTHSKAFTEGKFYIQSLSSMLPPIILGPQPGEEILDLTAAPGSKTTQIAAMMNNTGRIAAVEKVKSRFFKLKDNCHRQGASCVAFYCKDGATVWRSCENRFDRVLLDAPCSSEGRFSTFDPKSFQYWSEGKIKEMSRKQWPLLYSAFRSLKPGGVLVYSTCTFAPEENEQQIAKLIKKFGDQVMVEKIELPFVNLRPGLDPINNAIRVLPNDIMDGFFLCRIRKRESKRTLN